MPTWKGYERRQLKQYIATDEQGNKGLVTDEVPNMKFEGQHKPWIGRHLGPERVGELWYSYHPTIIRQCSDSTYRVLLYITDKAKKLKGLI